MTNYLQIVVPMAGRGSRFASVGYAMPKPLIPVGGRPMIEWVIENTRPTRAHRFIFLCLLEHLIKYPELPERLQNLCPGCAIVPVNAVTQGAACTVLLAERWINSDAPLMIANSDQVVETDIDAYLFSGEAANAGGFIMTFESSDPKWSYCRIGADGRTTEVVEKQVISNEATVGIYNFRAGREFVAAAKAMIQMNLRVNNEFYVAPVYNQLIRKGVQIATVSVGREGSTMHGLGTPEDLQRFKHTRYFREHRISAT